MWFVDVLSTPGYSPRIFLNGEVTHRYYSDGEPTNLESAHRAVMSACVWQEVVQKIPSDKGEWCGYEIPENVLPAVIALVTGLLGVPIASTNALALKLNPA